MRALLLVLLVAGCASDFRSLVPFPCPADAHCPEGLACVGGQCAVPALDTPCADKGVACDLEDASLTCTDAALCGNACGESGCGEGRVCASPIHSDAPCLKDCSGADGTCPEGLVCKPLWYGQKYGCLPAEKEVASCSDVTVTARCKPIFTCPRFTVTCGGGKCPENAMCTSTGCACEPGYEAVSCDEKPCTAATCGGALPWGCKELPSNTPAPGCYQETRGFEGRCHCVDGRFIKFACGESESCLERCKKP